MAEKKSKENYFLVLMMVIFTIGVLWRYVHILYLHPPSQHIYSDMKSYTALAEIIFDKNYQPHILHSFYPPGVSYIWGVCRLIEPTWRWAEYCQFIMSIGIVILIGLNATWLYGRYVSYISICISSLYFPFIDFGGYFLSEIPFIFFMLSTFALTILAMRLSGPRYLVFLIALTAGLFLGITAAIRSLILLQGLLLGGVLIWYSIKHGWIKIILISSGIVIGLMVVLVPLSYRCTQINEGRFCMISTNAPSNLAAGKIRDARIFVYHDEKRGVQMTTSSPSSTYNRYTKEIHFPFGAYDTREFMNYIRRYILDNPIDALLMSIQNVFDTFFILNLWPSGFTASQRWVILSQQAYLCFLLIPTICFICIYNRKNGGLFHSLADIMVFTPIVGLIIAVFLYNGEPRYRVPVDAFFIIIASRFYLLHTPVKESHDDRFSLICGVQKRSVVSESG